MKHKLLNLFLVVLMLLGICIIKTKTSEAIKEERQLDIEDRYFKALEYGLDYKQLESLQQERAQNVKGVYVNFWTLSHPSKREKIIKTIAKTELNAIVIDLKDIKGKTPFVTAPIKKFSYNLKRKELKKLISNWQRKGIYVIGRMAVFKDETLAAQDNRQALKYIVDTGGNLALVDSTEWTNPYSKTVWNYNINIAQEMAGLGLDEIQFDYIRFPTLHANSKLVIRDDEELSKSEAIVGFLKKAVAELKPYNTIVSADLFGLTTTVSGDLEIGQNIEKIAQQVDYISPMIYPSHYGKGIYGLKDPAATPYQLIAKSLADAKSKLGVDANKIRPWLQDFSLYHAYTKQEIQAQIKAVQDQNLSSWLLWNPQSIYTIEALMPKEQEEKNGS